MLVGNIVYKFNNRAYKYDVVGVDTSPVMKLIMCSSGLFDATLLMSNAEMSDVIDPNALESRRVDIKMSNVNVETAKNNGEKCPVNKDLFCRLGALIRYCKVNCRAVNEQGYTGLTDASGTFEAEALKKYTVDGMEVHLYMDTVCYLKASSPYFDIELVEDKGMQTRLFYAIKDGVSSGFQFNENYLGFKPHDILSKVEKAAIGNFGSALYSSIEEVVAAHPDKEFSWLLGKDYRIVDEASLEDVCDYIRNYDGYVFYDTETTGLNINFKSRIGQADQAVGIVLSVKYGESFFFPMQMKLVENLCGGDHFYFMEHYMRPILEGKQLVAHNASFDWKVAYIYNINANIVHDTMAILKLTYGAERKDWRVGLKDNAKLLLGRDSLELSDLVRANSWGESDVKFWDLPYELVRLYACADTDNTNGLLSYAIKSDLLNRYGAAKVYEIEVAFTFAVAYQEFMGHHIDVNNIEKMTKQVAANQAMYMQKMKDIVGYDFNPNSSKQLLKIMYTELGIPEQIDRKSGRPTTNKETLNKLAELTNIDGDPMYPFCQYLLEYRKEEGVRKIIDKFPETMTYDGYLFSEVQQYGTETGRVSIKSPNYQSYSDPVKQNVVPRPGYYMFDTDYSSVEYRVLGSMVGNKNIMKSFADPDFDYHTYQAAHMYGVPYAAVTKKLRKAAKGINFGLPYGMGDESLGVRVFGEASMENTRKAAALRAAYFKGQEDIRDWFEYHRNHGVTEGYTETFFGRRRYYHRADFSEAAIRRQAGNHVIQGCQSLETRILTKEFGIVKLGDVLGMNVTVWNGVDWTNGDVLDAGMKRKTVIKFRGGQTMICSPNHKFLVSTKKGGTMWVEAQHLHTTSEYANPHRIIINQNYEPGDYTYEYDDTEYSESNNANNVFLASIGESYKIGLFLGRLASDGSVFSRENGSDYITQFVAEHEFNILQELRDCMKNLNYKETSGDLRDGRNERMTRLSVYSESLVREILSLDIRHKIHKNIFMDTEVLRGFLCGYFDGDGGISGKSITCVFGKQDDFHQLVEDMQVALMFFGVRSHIREYDDRYVLQIKTNDNPDFLYRIGFMNEDKQKRGLQLECQTEEKVFGKCMLAESVEVTDELIPMADVCNTDGGFYVADGIVTHNTAADIYKTAAGRVFKRICREGWLGKVLISGFIHDEMLCEISNDIDPMKWLKAVREEFEVTIPGWCPLYMGCGFGMSWYEAKSTEIPIRLQWEWVEKYGETGYPDWHHDGREFCDKVPDMLEEFEVRDIRNQILDPLSQGLEIKPALNTKVLDCIKQDSSHYEKGVTEYMSEHPFDSSPDYLRGMESYLDKTYHIQRVLLDDEGGLIRSFKPASETQSALTQYCLLHDVDRFKVNLQSIEEFNAEASMNKVGSMEITPEDEDTITDDEKQRRKDLRVDTLGMYVDTELKIVTVLFIEPQYMNFLRSHCNTNGEGYQLYIKDNNQRRLLRTQVWLASSEVSIIQDMYIQYFNSKGVK